MPKAPPKPAKVAAPKAAKKVAKPAKAAKVAKDPNEPYNYMLAQFKNRAKDILTPDDAKARQDLHGVLKPVTGYKQGIEVLKEYFTEDQIADFLEKLFSAPAKK